MIKFTAEVQGNPKRRILGIGLSRENCERLLAGEPIQVDAMAVGMPAFEGLFIMAGETEQAMYDELKKHGVLQGVPIRTDGQVH